jgi:integrase
MISAPKRRHRAPNRAGSVSFMAASKRWRAQITLRNANGLPSRRVFYGKTQDEARGKMIEAQASEQKGTLNHNPGRAPTLQQYAEQWLETMNVRPKTKLRYAQRLAHCYPMLGNVQIIKLTPSHIQGLINKLRTSNLKSLSINDIRNMLRALLNQAMRDEIVSRNVATLVKPLPLHDAREMAVLEESDIPRFLEMAAEYEEGNLWIVGLDSGCRMSELQGLTWKDVDFEGSKIEIRRTLQRVPIEDGVWQWLNQPTKTEKSKRTVYLSAIGIDALRQQAVFQAVAKHSATGWSKEFGALVFTDDKGMPRYPVDITKRFRRALKRAKLPALRFHDLRHSKATLLSSQGVPIYMIADSLGHANVQTTQNLYRHKVDASQKGLAEIMGRLLAGPAIGS